MRKLLSIIMICLVGCGCFMGCSNKENTNSSKVTKISEKKSNPKDIIEEYFKYWNQKDINKIKSLETEELKKQHKDFELNNLKSIELISCKELDVNEEIKKGTYAKIGEREFDKENVKVFTVQFDIKSNENKNKHINVKNLQGVIILVRQDKNSNWLIQDIMANDHGVAKNMNKK